jgi:hypothetical protein
VVCEKRVYATERLPLDGSANTEVLHKQCLKCKDCQTNLKMDTYIRIGGAFYCKRHANDHQSSAHHNAPGAMQLNEASNEAASDKPSTTSESDKETDGAAAAAAGKFGTNVEKCIVCEKRVYATERLPLDGADSTEVLHKQCLKCSDCQTNLKMDTFIRVDGAFYCRRHAADHTSSAHHNAPGAMQLTDDSKSSTTAATKESESDKEADGAAGAGKFGANVEKCIVCEKRVYATERLPLDGTDNTAEVLHKQCLKCKDCQTNLKMDTFIRIGGAFFCKRHAADHTTSAPRGVVSSGAASFVPKVSARVCVCVCAYVRVLLTHAVCAR